jgi:hypothetical protein
MIEIYSKDMTRIIGYTISRYRLNFPEDMSREDLEQEVAIGLNNVPHDITAGDVIRHVIWSRVRIWKEAISRQHAQYTKNHACEDAGEAIHAKEALGKILKINKLTEQEKRFLKYRATGLDSHEIMSKMGLNNRQRLEQIKRVSFNKVREHCASAEYWKDE